jgi:hypothetical protein
MVRKLAAVFLLSFLVIAFVSVSLGAEKMQKPTNQRATISARYAPVYSFPTESDQGYTEPAPPPEKMLLGSGSRANPEALGQTSYDYQHNCTMGRQVEHRVGYVGNPTGTYIHFDWMSQLNQILGSQRGVGYQAYDLQGCTYSFAAGTGVRIEGAYSGYVGMDAHNLDAMNSWAVPVAHQNDDGYYAKAYWDYFEGGPVFGVFLSDAPTDRYGWYLNSGTGAPDANENIWPKHDWDIDGADYVLHMVTAESGGALGDPQTISYYRRVGPYGADSGSWSNQHVIDTVENINVTVTSSPISNKVAIVWNAPADWLRDTPDEHASQLLNDIWFAIDTTNGANWLLNPTDGIKDSSIGATVAIYDMGPGNSYDPNIGGNLTTYDSTSTFYAYCDISALWSIKDAPADWLQIVWGGRRYDPTSSTPYYRRQGAMYHWNQKFDEIKPVVKAFWDTGGDCVPYAWGTDVAKMTISECDGKFYICYTQFGTTANPCGTYDGTAGPQGRVLAGQLYMTVYDEFYQGWDRPQTVTGPAHAPGECTRPTGFSTSDGTCNSEYWSSMARYGRVDNCKLTPGTPAVDIIYVSDLTPGGAIQTESGVWNLNPVKWMVYPCRDAVPEPGFLVDPTEFGVCYGQPVIALGTTDDTTVTMTMENPGIIANSPVSIAVNYVSGGSGNTAVTATPNAGISIAPSGGQVPVALHITTTGEDEFVIVNYDIVITHQAGENPPNTATVPMCILVSDYYQSIESAIIATACKRLRVYNNGQMSNNAVNASLDFTTDPDDCATIYLYDGSPLICRDDAGTKVCYHSSFDNYYGTSSTMRAVSPLFVDSTSNPDYTYATAEFLTGDSAIGLIVEYFAPKDDINNCSYVIQKLKFWNRTEVTLNGVAAGEVLDWDVESHEHGSENFPGKDETRNLIYQTCNGDNQHDPCDTLQNCDRYAGIAAATGVGTDQDTLGFKNYLVLENDVFVYTTTPPTGAGFADNPLSPDTTYATMTGNNGYWWKNGPSNPPADTGEDLNTVVTFGVYDMDPNDTICVVKILTTSKNDANANTLKDNVDKANTFIAGHDEIKCVVVTTGCCNMAGDANDDEAVNIGDAVYLINYIFKGGPPPPCLDEGDANADCAINIGDGVYLINYIFKGGPPPICGCMP